MKTAFIFAGQGAQKTGMGKELYDNFDCVKDIYDRYSEIMGRDIKEISFNLPQEELNKTENAQAAIFTLSMAGLAIAKELGIKPLAIAGFSLGECSALAGAGVLSEEEAIDLIKTRGRLMQKAADETDGAMYAVIGLDAKVIENMCQEIDGLVKCVNYNCPGQTVIAGESVACEKAVKKLLSSGADKAVKLGVAGAFHTKLMQSAADEFYEYLKGIHFKKELVPVYSNVYGDVIETTKMDMNEYLSKQMTSAVKWQMIVENMIDNGIDTFIEFGPGRVLSGLIRRTNRQVSVFNIEDIKSLEKLKKSL